jgi:RNA polymerase sigma-70 factor (ECF subfamily)
MTAMAGQDSLALAAEPLAGEQAELCLPRRALPPFSEIYKQYLDFVWSSVKHLGVSGAAIDDVVQEIFIVISAKLHTVQQPDSLRSWIYGVVRRTVSGHRRARKPDERPGAVQAVELEQSLVAGPATPHEVVEHQAQLELLASLLAELDEPKREVFMLAELQEMPVPEIAEALDLPLNTAYSRLRAARAAFEAGLARRAARLKEKGLR